MRVNAVHFCALSSSPIFLKWLAGYANDVHNDLVAHLRKPKSCKANTEKMMAILDEITRRPGGEDAITTFLRTSFPYVLKNHGVLPAIIARSAVFDHYDPALLTIPRRIILESEAVARQFLADKPVGEYVVVDGKAYVEFLPQELAGLANQIPAQNWQTRTWRAVHHQ